MSHQFATCLIPEANRIDVNEMIYNVDITIFLSITLTSYTLYNDSDFTYHLQPSDLQTGSLLLTESYYCNY